MNGFQTFPELEKKWGEYLCNSGDISNKQHLLFLEGLRHVIDSVPDERFYLQKEAGFYRLRILDIIDEEKGIEYRINFHVFPKSKTHIHAHGYSAHSFVLDGEINYQNYDITQVSEVLKQGLEKSLAVAFVGREQVEEVRAEVAQELQEGLLGEREEFGFNTQLFAAFLGGGDDKNFGSFTDPKDIIPIVRNIVGSNFFECKIEQSGSIIAPGEYSIKSNQAHFVDIPNFASTLFITKRYISEIIPEGNFSFFPEFMSDFNNRQDITSADSRGVIIKALQKK